MTPNGSFRPIADITVALGYDLSVGHRQQNPFTGFLFTGPEDALARLSEAAKADGLKLVAVDAGDNVIGLCLASEQSFANSGMSLVNRAQAGEFGEVSLGLFGGEVQPPH